MPFLRQADSSAPARLPPRPPSVAPSPPPPRRTRAGPVPYPAFAAGVLLLATAPLRAAPGDAEDTALRAVSAVPDDAHPDAPATGDGAAPTGGGSACPLVPDAPFVAVQVNGSVLSDIASTSVLTGALGYTIRSGYRWSGWGVFGQFEQNLWFASEHEDALVEGAVNIGVGVDFTYASGFVQTSLVLGASILAFDTLLDDAGTVGFFLELRPVGLRWSVHPNVTLTLDAISFALVAPVLGKIPLVFPQYRTGFAVEVGW
jgi:hypothetical protein